MPGTQTIGLIMTDYYLKGKITVNKLVELLCINPCKIFGIKNRGEIKVGNFADLTIYKLNKKFTITHEWIESNCGWTPFNDLRVNVSPYATVVNGKRVVWDQKIIDKNVGKPYMFN